MNELEQLGEWIAEQAADLDAAMHRLLADLREFDRRGGWYVQGAESCAHWLAWRVGWDLVTARDHVRVARKLAEFPAIDDALRRGEVSYSKVRAMVRVATPDNESLLLDHARLMTASQLEVLCRKYGLVQRHGQDPHPLGDLQRRYVRRRDTEDGMVKIEAVLHPEEAELIWTMLNHAAAQLSRGSESAANQATLDAGVCRLDDSAESREEALGLVASVSPADVDTRATDDSAESHEVALGLMVPVSQEHINSRGMGDSTESRNVVVPVAMSTSAAKVDPRAIDDSAESREVALAGSVSQEHIAACGIDDSAELRRSEPETRSLLDRLLDEADALRAVEAVRGDDLDASSSPPDRPVSTPGASSSTGGEECTSSVLRQRTDAVRRAFSRADALVSLAQGYLRGDRPERSPIEVMLTIPASSLRGGPADPVEVGQMGESFVSREAARRLSCDAGIVEIVEDEHGAPLSVGRKRRTIAGALKRALRKRDETCTFPGCGNRIFLEGHHIKHWAEGGETSLDNGLLLCSFHHRYVHEYGYTIELGDDHRPRFRDSYGRAVAEVPERPTAVDLGWPRIRAMNAPLGIDADTPACGWDGRPADYGTIVGHLLAVDRASSWPPGPPR